MSVVVRRGGDDGARVPLAYGRCVMEALGVADGEVVVGVYGGSTEVDVVEERPQDEHAATVAVLSVAGSSASADFPRLTLAHALDLPSVHSVVCPAQLQHTPPNTPLPPRHPLVRVGVVMAAHNEAGDVLLTRRLASLRTFPRAWVLPGGHVDPGETLLQAGLRECVEETGVECDASTAQMVGAWESVFPTSLGRCNEAGEIKGHHIVFFLSARVAKGQRSENLKLQQEEVEMAAWVPQSVLRDVVTPQAAPTDVALPAQLANNTRAQVSSGTMRGIYPTQAGHGTAQGHLFFLHKLFGRQA